MEGPLAGGCPNEYSGGRSRRACTEVRQLCRRAGSAACAAGTVVEFRSRVLAAAESASEAKRGRRWRLWGLAGAMAAIVATLMIALTLHRGAGRILPENELAGAEKLAKWRAPSDALLETPGREILRTTPKLGESYLHVPAKTDEEE